MRHGIHDAHDAKRSRCSRKENDLPLIFRRLGFARCLLLPEAANSHQQRLPLRVRFPFLLGGQLLPLGSTALGKATIDSRGCSRRAPGGSTKRSRSRPGSSLDGMRGAAAATDAPKARIAIAQWTIFMA
jgi:hypothetical protein